MTAPFGSAVTVGSQDVEIDANGHKLIVGSSTVEILMTTNNDARGSTTIWTAGLSTFTAIL